MKFLFLVSASLAFASIMPACSQSDGETPGEPDGEGDVAALTAEQKEAARQKCSEIQPGRAWTAEESQKLSEEVMRRFLERKGENDRLIRERGIGMFAGVNSGFMKLIKAGDMAGALEAIRPHVKRGFSAEQLVPNEQAIKGTSCIGMVYVILAQSYEALGRKAEWEKIERCGRAWESDGLHVQQALIKSGWPAPTLPFVNDAQTAAGNENERSMHAEFLRAAARGSYYETPTATDKLLKDFLPSPGSRTRKDDAQLLAIGRSNFLAVGTLRAAYHVPLIVPARVVPDNFAPAGAARTAWIAARDRGEPFVIESHSTRQPWDATNFEIRPLTEVMSETFTQNVVYSTGTMLFSPHSDSPLAGTSPTPPAPGGNGGTPAPGPATPEK